MLRRDWHSSSDENPDSCSGLKPTVAFALLSPRINPIPSTRIACLNLFPFIENAGFTPLVLWEPAIPCETPDFPELESILGNSSPKILVFQKIRGPSVIRAIRAARARGIHTIWCVCDIVDNEMVSEADATITVTNFLRSLHAPELRYKIHVVHDGIENPDMTAPAVALPRRFPRAVLITSHELYALPVIGHLPLSWKIEIVGRYATNYFDRLKRLYWACNGARTKQAFSNVQAVCHPFIERTPWSPAAVTLAISRAQIGIIPVDISDKSPTVGCEEATWRVKSENRLTLLMAAGLPVIATPIPAYEDVLEDGVNGFFAQSAGDWSRLLRRLRDPELRAEVGAKARLAAFPSYSLGHQAARFVDVLHQVLGWNKKPAL